MDSIPTECTVLVIGGGPGGSYTASALAREGINTVVLEAETFPRYHVGESMVASIRHFLRFIDLDSTFENHGFIKKFGAAFKLNNQREAYTDFILSVGPEAYAWNVVRSEADDLIFRHAGKCGAKIFDGVKVSAIEWAPVEGDDLFKRGDEVANVDPGRPISASWVRKDGSSGQIKFDYLVDASGRAGVVSTKYLKNRTFNQDLKNVANWGYWKGAIQYGMGTPKEGWPFFEALHDGSGWAWFIPLHNGTVSVGVVMNQAMSKDKKRTAALDSKDFYLESVQQALGVAHQLSKAELVTDIKYASDWSYGASRYGNPYLRIVGDAGSFVDPYFSSGVHLALSGALSAAVTISASIRGDTDEQTAWKWHSNGVKERYTRFLLVVLGATKQIRHQDVPVMNEPEEEGFDRAFSIIRPVIQGIADVEDGKVSESEVTKAVDFTYNAVQRQNPEGAEGVLQRPTETKRAPNDMGAKEWTDVDDEALNKHEAGVLKMAKNIFGDYFTVDTFDGMVANVERGNLGLRKAPMKTGTSGGEAMDAMQPVTQMPMVASS